MFFLGIETSYFNTGVGIIKEKEFLALNYSQSWRHQENLFSLTFTALSHFGITAKDLAGIGVSIGPGMFTSIRVGLSCAKSLALPHNIPIKGIDTFTGLAQTFYTFFPEEGPVVIVLDAKRQSVYVAVYKNREMISQPVIISPQEVISLYQDGIFLGSGLDAYPEVFKGKKVVQIYSPSPLVIASLAKEAILRGERDDIAELVPFYFRPPDIRLPV